MYYTLLPSSKLKLEKLTPSNMNNRIIYHINTYITLFVQIDDPSLLQGRPSLQKLHTFPTPYLFIPTPTTLNQLNCTRLCYVVLYLDVLTGFLYKAFLYS